MYYVIRSLQLLLKYYFMEAAHSAEIIPGTVQLTTSRNLFIHQSELENSVIHVQLERWIPLINPISFPQLVFLQLHLHSQN